MFKPEMKIIFDHNDFMVVSKPAGWLSIPGRGHQDQRNILSHEVGRFLRGASLKKDNDLFIVHRLDIGTSGVIIFAKNTHTHREFNALFESRQVTKKYWCVAKGTIPDQIIDAPIFKIPSKKIRSVVDPKGKDAQTKVSTLHALDNFSLLEAQPLTGRSHQIRVHLAHAGAPLVGDPLYGGSQKEWNQAFEYPLLHAKEIEFHLQSHKKFYHFEDEVSGAFLNALDKLNFKSSP
jgi:RluA family pseudouridine synthase